MKHHPILFTSHIESMRNRTRLTLLSVLICLLVLIQALNSASVHGQTVTHAGEGAQAAGQIDFGTYFCGM